MDSIIDLRVVKTLEHIKEGFTNCLKKQTFSSITIKDITTAAKINRSTFYKHYMDKFHLRDTLINDTLDALRKNFSINNFHVDYNDIDQSMEILVNQLEFMYGNKDWYTVLWTPNIELDIFHEMQRVFEENIRKDLRTKDSKLEIAEIQLSSKQELFVRLFASSAMTTITWWYEQAVRTKPEEVARLILDNIKYGMHRTFLQNT